MSRPLADIAISEADLEQLVKPIGNLNQSLMNENIAQLVQNMPDTLLTSYYLSNEERIANELAENNSLQREILGQMRTQRLERENNPPELRGELERIQALSVAFDILDAATERCLSDNMLT
jgi:hypothetical protein